MICSKAKVNSPLLPLKACFFLIYSAIFASLPYVSIISTQLCSYEQLSILFACATVISTSWPVILGFIADKLGQYKPIIITATLLTGIVNIPLIWLQSDPLKQGFNSTKEFNVTPNYVNESNYLADSQEPSTATWFPLLLVIRILGFISMDSACSLLDASGLAMTKKYHGDFGLQKMWSMASIVIVPPLCGLAVDTVSSKLGYKEYSAALYISAALAGILIPILWKLEIQVERNPMSLIATARRVISMIDVDIFLLVQVVIGICMGFHVMYLSVYVIDELQGSSLANGFAFGIGGVSAMLAVASTKMIIKKLGESGTVSLSLVLYSARFIAFYFIRNPWFLLATELLDGFSGFLGATTGCYYCANAAPPGMLASLNGLLAASTHGIGRGLGMSFGSGLISEYGIRTTYLLLGICSGVVGLTYLIMHKLFLKRIEKRRLASHAVKCLPRSDPSYQRPTRELQFLDDEFADLRTAST